MIEGGGEREVKRRSVQNFADEAKASGINVQLKRVLQNCLSFTF